MDLYQFAVICCELRYCLGLSLYRPPPHMRLVNVYQKRKDWEHQRKERREKMDVYQFAVLTCWCDLRFYSCLVFNAPPHTRESLVNVYERRKDSEQQSKE